MKFLANLTEAERIAAAEIMRTPDGFAWVASGGKQLRPPHLKILGDALAGAIGPDSKQKQICVTMPPRHGKSQLCSWWYVVWFLWRFPEKRVILCSYGADFAAEWGRKVRNTMTELKEKGILDFDLAEDSKAADHWETSKGGGMTTAGVGGEITGRGADLLILDDPVKNEEEAQSEVYRNKAWAWFRSTFLTRREPGCSVVIVQTRWHESDLMGMILSSPETKQDYALINFPALCEDAQDVLGRKPGDALWPERYDKTALAQIKRQSGSYTFSCLYQQNPIPAEGGLFKKDWFKRRYRWISPGVLQVGQRVVEVSELRVFCTTDLATSVKTSADYTVISTWGHLDTDKPLLFLLDVRRDRMEGPDIGPEIASVVREWNPDFVGVEKVGFQLTLIQHFIADGLPIREMVPDKDKISRALAITPFCEAGMVVLPEEDHEASGVPWVADVEHEMYSFPNGKNDDFVDTLSQTTYFIAFGEIGIAGDVSVTLANERKAEVENAIAQPSSMGVESQGDSPDSIKDLFDKFTLQ